MPGTRRGDCLRATPPGGKRPSAPGSLEEDEMLVMGEAPGVGIGCRLGRRPRFAALLMALVVSPLPFVPPFSVSTASAAQAARAGGFTDSVCVNTHLHFSDTP